MKTNSLLLERSGCDRPECTHDGKVIRMRSTLRRHSDGLEFTCRTGDITSISCARVARELDALVRVYETVDRIFDLAKDMEPEDGVIWVHGLHDDSVIAFSPFGIESLRDVIKMDQKYDA